MKTRPSSPSAFLALAAAAVLLSACGTTRLPEDQRTAAPVETRSPVATSTTATRAPSVPATSTPLPQSSVATVDLAAQAAARSAAAAAAGAGTAGAGAAALLVLPSQRVVYFDYDSFVIKDDFKSVLDGYSRVLSAQRGKRLTIEGHTDERGGREYNLALGQKRAAAVLGSLKLLGVNEAQMEAVSFGEERPAATGNGEPAWAKNRRAELKDR